MEQLVELELVEPIAVGLASSLALVRLEIGPPTVVELEVALELVMLEWVEPLKEQELLAVK